MLNRARDAITLALATCTLAFATPAMAEPASSSNDSAPLQYSSAFKVTAGEEAAIDRIIEDIGDRRVVALGEISHGDGSSFLFKARLIERLHRDHGFDVLAMEGGIYDHLAAEDRIAAGEQPSKAFGRANFGIWTLADQFAPMLDLVDKADDAGRPFSLVGFDFQHSGDYRDDTVSRFVAIADRLGDDGAAVRFLVSAWYSLHRAKEGPDSAFDAALAQIESNREQALAAIAKAGGPDAGRDARLIDNLGRFVRHRAMYLRLGLDVMGWDEFNVRDAMMGANLNAQAKQLYPDRKIVIWAATAHVIKDRAPIDGEMPMVPMGYHIDQGPLSHEYYVLAFSAYAGRNGSMSGKQWDIDPADADSIEAFAMSQDESEAVALVEMPECGSAQAKIRALGHQYYTGDWGCAIDSVVVFRDLLAATYPQAQ